MHWRSRVSLIVWLAGAMAVRPAAADRDETDAARVDWAAGRVTAGGTGIADRHAPSPAVALGTSRRGAEDAARRRILAKLPALPLAAGGTLAARLADPAVQARVEAAVAAAISVAAEPETDGSWHVTLGLPLEAIRIAIDQPRALSPAGDQGPAVIVVDGATTKPAIGVSIGGIAAATLWMKAIPSWAKDAPRIKATSSSPGSIAVASNPGSAATLYIVITNS